MPLQRPSLTGRPLAYIANLAAFPIPFPAPPPPAEVSSLRVREVPTMSDLSTIKNEFLSFLNGVLAHVPAEAQPAVQAAASSVTSAISTTESALVSTAESAAVPAVSAVISKDVPVEFQPLASLALQLGIAALTAKAGL